MSASSRWILRPLPRPRASLRLFCLPFGGAGASAFRHFPSRLPESVEVLPVELPGRESRLDEPAITHMPAMLEALQAALEPLLGEPYAFFGHSMGGLISYELTRLLLGQGKLLPVRLFLSAVPAVQVRRQLRPLTSELPDEELARSLAHRYGTPVDVIGFSGERKKSFDVIRNDLRLVESWSYEPAPPLPVPLSVFAGERDPGASPQEVEPWRERTTADFRFRVVGGGHFFLFPERETIARAIEEDLGLPAAR